MPVVFNPFTGNLDLIDNTAAAGSDTQVQFNDGGVLGGDSGLVFNKTTNALTGGSFIPTSSSVPTNGVYLPAANSVALSVNGSEGVRLTTTGLGIGTSSPQAKLHIQNTANTYLRIERTASGTESNFILGAETLSNAIYSRDDASGSKAFDIYTGTTSRLHIAAGGNVGIGTTNPQGILETASSSASNVYLTSTGGNSNLRIVAQDGGLSSLVFGDTSDAFTGGITFDHSDNSLQFFGHNYAERARVDSSGRLLVGTSSDSGGALLQVNGNRIRVATAKTPASATDTGTAGEICWDASYIYVCTATNTWKRAALSTW